jgi:hypothetical protein
MRAEDLFEAVGGIDDKLIARSDRRVRSSQKKPSSGKAAGRTRKRKSRRSVGAEIYRFTVVAMSTAVVVFLFLMARDLLGIRNLSDIKNRIASTQESSISESVQADEIVAEQAEESAAMQAEEPAAEKAAESANQQAADNGMAEEASEDSEYRAAGNEAAEADGRETAKVAVDMLGELKGDYVSLEYISAEDEANGGSRKVPEYTEEGEIALSEAFSKGKPTPAVFASTGEATYYVYLTRKNGEVHRAVFYENAYVSMDNIPGVVMKISQADYEEVKVLFR